MANPAERAQRQLALAGIVQINLAQLAHRLRPRKNSLGQIIQYQRRKAQRIEVDHEKMVGRVEQLLAELEQLVQLVFELPLLAVGAAPVGGRVQDEALVVAAALHLAAHVFHGIFHQPAHAVEAAGLHVVAGPEVDLLHRIEVGHVGPGGAGGQGSGPGVGKQVEHPRQLGPALKGLIINELPVGVLLREQAHVLERRQPSRKRSRRPPGRS